VSAVSLPNALMLGAALSGWAAMALAFVRALGRFGRRRAVARDPRGRSGLALQLAGAALVWSLRRPPSSSLVEPGGPVLEGLFVLATVGLVAGAAALQWSAFRRLGSQWSLEARVRSDHELVTGGPYGRIRHPIYAGFGALLLATGLAVASTVGIAAGLATYASGTAMRIRGEESVLRAAFGDVWAAYAARVPAFVPRLRA